MLTDIASEGVTFVLRKFVKSVVFVQALLISLNAAASSDSVNTPIEFRGEFAQGGLIRGYAPGVEKVFLDDLAVQPTESGHFVFGFGRNASSAATLSVVFADGHVHKRQLSIRQRIYPTQRVDGVPNKTVNPPAEVLARIRSETQEIKRARAKTMSFDHFSGDFMWPLQGPISGVYGSQRIYNGVPKRPHYGVDVAAPVGTKVKAPAAGTVTLAQRDNYYSGGTLIIDHGYNLSSTMIHLSRILVAEGEQVVQGQYVAEVGQGGRATGPHLDWRMNWKNRRIDPQLILAPMPNNAPKATEASSTEIK